MIDVNAKLLLIYTGGTIGMVENIETGTLEPFNFDHLYSQIPDIRRLRFSVDHIVFDPIIDSSEINPDNWITLVKIIEKNYDKYDGFVILHGTDTMSYTASALSFMIENVTKPIILTGAQLPIGKLRTDARENLITALEIAADKKEDGNPKVTEVCIFFQNYLLRGNRTSKVNADNFNAFRSFNYTFLAKSGINIKYNDSSLLKCNYDIPTKFHYRLDQNIAVLKIFPGIQKEVVEAIVNIKNLRGLILETYGTGNAPLTHWFLELIEQAVNKGIIVVNITQCKIGFVDMSRYLTGNSLLKAGVVSGYDCTVESAITKLMILLGHHFTPNQVREKMTKSLTGEISTNDKIDDLDNPY